MFQLPLGILGQVYAVCAFIGCAFVFGSAALGMLEGGHEGAVDLDGDGVPDTGIDLDGDGVPDIGTGSTNARGAMQSLPMLGLARMKSGLAHFFLSLLSPMAVAMFVGFFGLGGLLAAYVAPWLGIMTLAVALVTAAVCSNILKSFMRWMLKSMHVSSSAGTSDIIGQTAEVLIPINPQKVGEVVYVVHSKRYNSSARLLNTESQAVKGDKVVIVDVKDHVVLVEPCDLDL